MTAGALIAAPYRMAVGLRNLAFDRGWLRAAPAGLPVISVGNLSVGGTGKTPLVLVLAGRLLEAGVPVGVLSRGYGRRSRHPVIVPGGELLPGPAEIGDEPWLLRRRLPGLALGVDARRRRAAEALGPHLRGGVFLLDDGFQHRELARDLDVVVVAADEPLEGGRCLPAGRFREPPASLRRADHVVIVAPPGMAAGRGLEVRRAEVTRLAPGPAVTVAAVRLAGFRPLGEAPAGLAAPAGLGSPVAPPVGLGGPVAALAAIARPDRFAATLEAAGLEVASRAFFRDHRRFSGGDLEGIERRARSAAAIVTTEKDEPRLLEALGRHGSGRLGVPVWVAVTELDFLAGETELRDAVARTCGSPLDASASSVAGASSEGGRT